MTTITRPFEFGQCQSDNMNQLATNTFWHTSSIGPNPEWTKWQIFLNLNFCKMSKII